MIRKSGFEMSKGQCRRLLRGALGRFAQTGQCRADGGLCLENTLPDPIRRRIAQAAIEIAKSLQFIAAGHRIFQKGPQALGGQEKAFDLIGPPDVEGPSTSGGSLSIAAKDPLRSSRFATLVLPKPLRASHGAKYLSRQFRPTQCLASHTDRLPAIGVTSVTALIVKHDPVGLSASPSLEFSTIRPTCQIGGQISTVLIRPKVR